MAFNRATPSCAVFLIVSAFVFLQSSQAGQRDSLSDADAGTLNSFESWVTTRKENVSKGAAVDDAVGEQLARNRRNVLKELIKRDPKAALNNALSVSLRKGLPARVTQHLEERISGKGTLGTLAVQAPADPTTPRLFRVVEIGGKTYTAHVYGKSENISTTHNLSIHGVAVDDTFALLDSRVRVLESGEKPDPAKAAQDLRCPVSGKEAGLNQEPADNEPDVVAESGDKTFFICSAAHVGAVDEQVAGSELLAPAYNSIGTKSVLVMRVDFTDKPGESVSQAQAETNMEAVRQYFYSSSFQQMDLSVVVTSLLRMPQTGSYYSGGNKYSEMQNDARAAAVAAGYDTSTFQHDVLTFTGIGFGWGGLGWVGGKGSWVQGNGLSTGVTAHELGHNVGNWHANYWSATGDSIIGPGTHGEYGNPFDVLGSSGSFPNGQFNSNFKNNLNWIPAANLHTASSSGTFQIYAMDHGGVLGANRYAITVPINMPITTSEGTINEDYWLEFRQKFTSNRWLMSGITLKWGKSAIDKASRLLDTTPNSPDGKNDSAIVVGRTYSDTLNGVHITPIRKMGTAPESVEVVVNRGSFTGNRAPTLSLSASSTAVLTNATVTFNATGSDPDGDAVAYHWDFGDRTFGTSADSRTFTAATKSWAAAGQYTVRCTVSDMKGQSASDSVVITVGSPTTFKISGRALDDQGQPLADVRVHNGKVYNDAAYRYAYTDSDGTYSIVSLAAGSFTVGAVKNGYTLVADAGWSNPVAVGPDAANVNFTGTPVVFSIAGKVTDENGSAVQGVQISDGTRSTTTNSSGDFTIAAVPAGSYTLTAIKAGYTFTGSGWSNPVFINGASATARNFTNSVTRYSISGQVVGGSATTTVTDGFRTATCYQQGSLYYYNLFNIPAGTWTIRALESGKSFSASNFTNPVNFNGNKSNMNFALDPTQAFAISGRVTDVGSGLSGTTISVTGAAVKTTTTDKSGYYYVSGLANGAYSVTPSKSGASFSPTSRAVTVASADSTGQDFVTIPGIPSASIAASDSSASETPGNGGTFTLSFSNIAGADVTVNYTISGSATHGTDYSSISSSVVIPVGLTSATVTITPIDDSFFDGTETVLLTLGSGSGYFVGPADNATVTITDNESAPTATLVATDSAATEAAGNSGTFTVTLSGQSATATSVNFSRGGTAANSTDYSNIGGSVSVPAGSTTAAVTISPVEDTTFEGSETVILTLFAGTGYAVGAQNSGTVTIADNDSAPAATITATDSASSEGPLNTGTFTVTLSNPSSTATNVNFTVGGTATNGTDYTTITASVSVLAGSTTATKLITPTDDSVYEGTETVVLTLAAGTGYSIGSFSAATVTLADSESPPVATITATDNAATETAGNTGTFTITLSGLSSSATTVNFTAGGSAVNGTDYTSIGTSVSITAGATTKTITITPTDDAIVEGNETLVVTLASGTGYSLGAPGNAAVAITDNEAVPTVTLTASDASAAESGGDTATLWVTLSAVSSANTVVNFTVAGSATSGADYTALSSSVTILSGATSALLTITPLDDATFEGSETLVLTLADGAGYYVDAPSGATVTLADDEVNTAPVAVNASFNVAKKGSYSGTLQASDIDQQALAISIVAEPGKGTVVLTNAATGAFTYTPNALARGADSFTFKANDGLTDSPVATLSVRILNRTPVAASGSLSADAGVAVSSEAIASDDDSDVLAFEVTQLPAQGTLDISTVAGQFTYTPHAGASGADSFTFAATDGEDTSASGTIRITIRGKLVITSEPAAQPNPALPGQTVTLSVAGTGNDPIVWTWTFGDGSAEETGASVLHAYVSAGTFAAGVSGVDATGQTLSGSLNIVVRTDEGGGGGGAISGVDSDGDGVNDDYEIADGTDPLDAASFKKSPMTVSKLSGSVKFNVDGADFVSVSGIFPTLPAGFNPLDFAVDVDVGGARQKFARGIKGSATAANASFKLKLKYVKNSKTKTRALINVSVPFTFSLKKGTWLDEWADEGADETVSAKNARMTLVVDIKLLGRIFSANVPTLYTSKAGKSGKFKK